MTGAIVIGGHVQGYGILRILGEKGIPCVVIDSQARNIARHSKYCRAFYQCSIDELDGRLEAFQRKNRYHGWVLFPTDDLCLRYMSQNKARLSKHFKVAADDWDKTSVFFDKCRSYPVAESCGVPVPKTLYPQDRVVSTENLHDLMYPCIIKPAVMKEFYPLYKKKVLVCNSIEELISLFREVSGTIPPERLMIQEIIPGNSENQYSVGLFFHEGATVNYLIARRRRQHPPDFGNATTYAETVDLPILLDYAKRILREVDYSGVCEVEFKYDQRDGRYKFLEVNPRLWKWHLIAKQANVPVVTSYFSYLTNGRTLETTRYENAAWKDDLTDAAVCAAMMWKRIYCRPEKKPMIHAVFNPKDPLPYVKQLLYLPHFFKTR
jgi:predicted ATP-grasp superfamily ATP-dependent carboligase